MGNATCAAEGCEKPVMAKGYCSPHYGRWRYHGDPLAGGPERARYPKDERPGCAIEGCERLVKALGWCSVHYQRWKRNGNPESGRAAPGAWAGVACKVSTCEGPADGGLGWCKRHYQKWYKTGDAEAPDKYTRRGAPLRERIEARIIKTDYCWFWTGRPNSSGYGMIGVKADGRARMRLAHRVSYEVFVGPIPEGLVLDHLCRNRACVRPDHLEPVLHEVNVRRGASTGRGTHCANEHEFTEENTYWLRVCITCHKASRDRWRARERSKARKAA